MAIIYIESCNFNKGSCVYSELVLEQQTGFISTPDGTFIETTDGRVITRQKICKITDVLRNKMLPNDKTILVCSTDNFIEENFYKVQKKACEGESIDTNNPLERACNVLYLLAKEKGVSIEFNNDYSARQLIVSSAKAFIRKRKK